MRTTKRKWLIAGLMLLAGIICIGAVQAVPVTVFSDNFNDNSLDTAKWTADVAGTNCAFWERNSRAEFQTYGAGAQYWHSYLNSKPIIIDGWESIEITGKWTNNGYTSRTHIATFSDLTTPANTISIEYSAWGSQMAYYWNGGSSMASVPVPSPSLVPFRLKITKTGFEYYENGVLKMSKATNSMANSRRFQLQIGAWEYSAITSQTYIDEIVVQYTETVPPITTATVMSGSPGPGGWYTAPVMVSLSAYDPAPGSGLDVTQYSLDGTTWTTYGSPVTVSNEGTINFLYRSIDKAGNTETAKSLSLKIDRTPPATVATTPAPDGLDGWFVAPVEVTLTATDPPGGSGIAGIEYSVNNGVWQPATGSVTLAQEGTVTLSYRAKDIAGNTEPTRSQDIRIDTAPPVTAAVYSGTTGTNGWFTSPVTVTLTADDGTAGSGVQATSYRIGSGTSISYTAPFAVSVEGESLISFQSSDNAGNREAEQTGAVTIDTIRPVLSVTAPEEKDYIQNGIITTTFTATDATSGIATVAATVNGAAVSDGQILDLTGLALGPHTFTATAVDAAGNTATESRTFTVMPVPALVNIDPDTLNLKSQSDRNAVTVYIELADSDVNAIDVGSVTLTYAGRQMSAQATPTSIGDVDSDGIPDRMVKFNRQELIGIVVAGDSITLTVNGRVAGDSFTGSDTIRVIGEAKEKGSGNKK